MLSILQTLSVIAAIVVAVGTIKGRNDSSVEELAQMKADLRYIKERVDDLPDLRDRLIVVEQKSTRAHERIDDISKRIESLEKKGN